MRSEGCFFTPDIFSRKSSFSLDNRMYFWLTYTLKLHHAVIIKNVYMLIHIYCHYFVIYIKLTRRMLLWFLKSSCVYICKMILTAMAQKVRCFFSILTSIKLFLASWMIVPPHSVFHPFVLKICRWITVVLICNLIGAIFGVISFSS